MQSEPHRSFAREYLFIGPHRARPPFLLVTVAAALSFLLTGYQFAAWDQILYLPLINGYVDPAAFSPYDAYMQGFLWKSYTTLFLVLTPFVNAFGWEWPVFIAYVAVKFFLFLGLWALAFRLTRNHRAAALTVLLLVANALCKNLSAQFPSSTLICRFVVMPFLLFGLERFLARQFRASAILFGLAFQIHALTTSFWLVLVVFIALFNARSLFSIGEAAATRRHLIQASLIFAALVLPMILWFAFTPTPFPKDFTVEGWLEITRIKNWYSFIASWTAPKWEDLLFSFALVGVTLPRLIRDGTWRPFAALATATVVALGLHYFVSEVVLFRPLFQLQWIRIMDIPMLTGVIAAAHALTRAGRGRHRWIVSLAGAVLFLVMTIGSHDLYVRVFTLAAVASLVWNDRRVLASLLLTATAALLFVMRPYGWTAFPPVLLGTFGTWQINLQLLALSFGAFAGLCYADRFRSALSRRSVQSVAIAGLFVMSVFVYPPNYRRQQPEWRGLDAVRERWARVALPGSIEKGNWFALQRWARDNTPKGTLLFLPPGKFGFRTLSTRSPFIEYVDGEVGIFSPDMAREWKRRMQLIGYWPPTIGGSAVNPAINAYHAIPAERWIEMARQEHVDYLVTSRPVQLPFEKLHTVGEYTVWQIPKP